MVAVRGVAAAPLSNRPAEVPRRLSTAVGRVVGVAVRVGVAHRAAASRMVKTVVVRVVVVAAAVVVVASATTRIEGLW